MVVLQVVTGLSLPLSHDAFLTFIMSPLCQNDKIVSFETKCNKIMSYFHIHFMEGVTGCHGDIYQGMATEILMNVCSDTRGYRMVSGLITKVFFSCKF